MRTRNLFALIAAPVLTLIGLQYLGNAEEKPTPTLVAVQGNDASPHQVGLRQREPWNTSRISGSPDPPPPYRLERTFPHLRFENPVEMDFIPGSNRVIVSQWKGQIVSFANDQGARKTDLVLDVKIKLEPDLSEFLELEFHPNFEKNRYVYLCYHQSQGRPQGSKLSRFTLGNTNPPQIDLRSELPIISWDSSGHTGACVKFGPDGYLYASIGDAAQPSPPDPHRNGQDLSNIQSAIIRIDVDKPQDGQAYSIPPDNPFVDLSGARGEIWSYGFRNPWRMAFDRVSGDLLVGDVGWELLEMIHVVQRGGNCGWSINEGSQPNRPEQELGPTPIIAPLKEHPHSEARSITGGRVYRGQRFKDLQGAYIYGDFETGTIWALRYQENRVTWFQELARSTLQVVSFAEDLHGELYILDYLGGGVYQLEPDDTSQFNRSFPKLLSETGLFSSLKDHIPAGGVVPYSINAQLWNDRAIAERFVAIPGNQTVSIRDLSWLKPSWEFPKDSVLVKTLSLELERGNSESQTRLETQIVHFDGKDFRFYSYHWNDEQTEATLGLPEGRDQSFTILDPESPGGSRQQTWHYASRAECAMCHGIRNGYALGFTLPQLNRSHDYESVVADQLATLEHVGILGWGKRREIPESMVDPYDDRQDLSARARAWLHINCSHCHRENSGGSVPINVQFEQPLQSTHLIAERPTQGTFNLPAAQVVAPGDPYRSVLLYRTSSIGGGHMPRIGSNVIDDEGISLLHDWIVSLSTGSASTNSAKRNSDRADQFEMLKTVLSAPLPTQLEEPAQVVEAVKALLSTPSGALMLAFHAGKDSVGPERRDRITALAVAHPDTIVRDLFERFIPEEQRSKRLGTVVEPEKLLKLRGHKDMGRALFFDNPTVQCRNCHRIGDMGSTLGPDLSKIGEKYRRPQLLETILEPSKQIENKYIQYLIETVAGQVVSGLLVEKTDEHVILRDANDKQIRVAAEDIEMMVPRQQSIMPELLLRDMTEQDVADLLEFLESLK